MIADAPSADIPPRKVVIGSLRCALRGRRWLWAIATLAVLGVGAGALGKRTVAKPGFCGICHIVRPYVQSWQYSRHRDVHCTECHSRPSMVHSLRRLSQVRRVGCFMPGSDHPMSDSACARCHNDQSDLPVMDPCVFDADEEPPPCTKCHPDVAHWSRE